MRSAFWRMAILALWISAPLHAADVDELFARANSEYQEGNFAGAIEIYEQILDQGWESGELYYNLGNSYFRQDRLGPAILNFERARRFLAGDSDVERNLEIANLRVVDKIEPLAEFLPVRWARATLRILTTRSWLWVTLSAYWIVILILSAWFLSNRDSVRRWLVRAAILAALFSGLAGGMLGGRLWLDRAEVPAIVFESEVAARSAPAAGAPEVFRIHEGTRVRTGTRSDEWTEIILADGKVGWVPSETLEIV